MNEEIYDKVFQRIKQIDSLKCGSQIVEFEIFDEYTKYPFSQEKKILHSFTVSKKDNGESGAWCGLVYLRHELYLCDRPMETHTITVDPYDYIDDRLFIERYEYMRGEEYLTATAIEFGGQICKNIRTEEYDELQKFMLFNDNSIINFDKFFEIFDLKIVALV